MGQTTHRRHDDKPSPHWRLKFVRLRRIENASKLKRFGLEQPIADFFWWVIEQIPQEA